jgi:hypothetical protein
MSEGVTENGILPEKEYEEYHAKTSRYRFMNQMFLGIGGAMVFGRCGARYRRAWHISCGRHCLHLHG